MMFFRKRIKNRRLGRQYVLEVKMRSSQIRATRARMASMAVLVVFATIFAIYVAWRGGDYALNTLIYENRTFALQEIDIQTDGSISIEQLQRWSGVKPGENLFALDLARVKRDLEMIPLVRFASIERVLPGTLRIRVQEREPLAQANILRLKAEGGLEVAVFHMDQDGFVLLPLEQSQRATPLTIPAQYPVISGIDGAQLQPGRRIELPQVLTALQLITAFERSPMLGLTEISRIDVSMPEVLVITTSHGGEVTFSLSNLDQQLLRWREIFDMGQKAGLAIATLDLAVANNIPVRWLEASAVPPPPPKNSKPQKTRNKHV
jgi:cell division septal protein FtsQ